MTSDEFAAWRQRLFPGPIIVGQRRAAAALGISLAMVRLYERGARHDRDDKPVAVPRRIELAAAAVEQFGAGATFDGTILPPAEKRRKPAKTA